jgi:hypothetical protein
MESELELKKLQIKNNELIKEAELAQKRTEEELKRKHMQLEYESKELELLKILSRMLILTPQAARLAEASQSLKKKKCSHCRKSFAAGLRASTGVNRIFQNFLKIILKPITMLP